MLYFQFLYIIVNEFSNNKFFVKSVCRIFFNSINNYESISDLKKVIHISMADCMSSIVNVYYPNSKNIE